MLKSLMFKGDVNPFHIIFILVEVYNPMRCKVTMNYAEMFQIMPENLQLPHLRGP